MYIPNVYFCLMQVFLFEMNATTPEDILPQFRLMQFR